MPEVGNTITYTAQVSPNVGDTYAWSLSGGGTINGSSSSSTVSVTWNSAGTHTVYLTVSNACSTKSSEKQEVITVNCVPQWNDAVPSDIRCGVDPEVQQDACKQYKKQVQTCTGNVQWVYHSDNTGCGGCGCTTTSWTDLGIYRCENGISEQQQGSNQCVGVTQWVSGGNACTNNVAGTASSTVDYYKSCPSGCTAIAVPYPSSSTVSIGSVSASSVGQANADAQTQANNNVAADQAANGQNNANSKSDSEACDCPTVFTSTQTVTECSNFTRNNCDPGCTGTSATVCRDGTETRTSTNSQSEADSLASSAASATAINNVNNDGQAYANANASCNCPLPCPDQFNSGIVSPPATCGLNQTVTVSSYVNNMTPDTKVTIAVNLNFGHIGGGGSSTTTIGTNATKTFGFATYPWPFASNSNYVGEVLGYGVLIERPGCPDVYQSYSLTCIENQAPCDPDGTFIRYESDGCTTCRDAGGTDYNIPGLIEILANGNCGERAGNSIPGNCGGDTYIGPC